MPEPAWEKIDAHFDRLFAFEDDALREAIAASRRAKMPQIQVSAAQGKLLCLLARATGAQRVLEIGTLAGYSTIWLARGLRDDGVLVTLELEQQHAEVARANVDRAGVGARVEIRVGPALESLDTMIASGESPFELVFIDADKAGYTDYLARVLQLTRTGSLIIADNVVRKGAVLDPPAGDESAHGAARFNAALAAEPRVDATIVQTVGAKGHDGLAVAVVR